jgi:hypothetical protein
MKDALKRWNSRKLVVLIATMVGIPAAELPTESWYLAIAYIVAQAVVDIVKQDNPKEVKDE